MALTEIQLERKRLFDRLFREYHEAPFSVCMPGWRWSSSLSAEPVFTILLKDSQSLEKALQNPTELSLGEAFINGEIEIEGDLFSAISMAEHVFAQPLSLSAATMNLIHRVLAAAANGVLNGHRHSRRCDQAAIAYHYDRPAQFFRPWLGSAMAYSCAYFRHPADDLDKAQSNKMDLICRKLELQAEDSFLDIGCGWGSLALHAASQYGARVRGVTLSREQARYAGRRISQRKLGEACFVEMRDYRDLPELPYRYNKMASVGMFEHVGQHNLSRYFQIAYELLTPGGLFLNQGIARSYTSAPRTNSFVTRFVFPDGELVPLYQTIQCAEAAGFEVRDVENLREHYVQTLRLWVSLLRKFAPAILAEVPEKTYRIWLLYMAGSALAFQRGEINVNQVLLRRRAKDTVELPSTREHWYENQANTGVRQSA
jgi:cyclopropane-fatty-acyl-phospholipid synthase